MFRYLLTASFMSILSGCSGAETPADPEVSSEAIEDVSVYEQRRSDWRTGAVTYQIFVDRFVPPADLEAKRDLYAPPRILKTWNEQPEKGDPVPEAGIWTHELSFWGGDLAGVRTKVGYLRDLGVDVVYLNPIHEAPSNHKYDATDFTAVAPEYGTFEDLADLAGDLHKADMHIVLDGVFNHMSRKSDWFMDAMSSENSPYHDWFEIGEEYQNGYVGWWGVGNLPELNWDNAEVRERFVDAPDSVVRTWFQYGIDGWRLDVASELGYEHLTAIREAAHQEKPGSLVVGEIWAYPAGWTNVIDATMNFSLREMLFRYVGGEIAGAEFGTVVNDMVQDAGIDPLLRSWIVLDNHDTPRLKTLYPDERERSFLQMLQFSLPGAPVVYYGVEGGMEGGEDPGSRGPMDWDSATTENPEFIRLKRLIQLREDSPALSMGDYLHLETRDLLAFLRTTDRSAETMLVVANNGGTPVTETLMLRDGTIMSGEEFEDVMTGEVFRAQAAVLQITVPALTVRILKPKLFEEHEERTGHSPYKNIP